MEAFILIRTQIGRTREVLEEIKKMNSVNYADPTTGPYDIIAVVQADNAGCIDYLKKHISKVSGVEGVVSCVCLPMIMINR